MSIISKARHLATLLIASLLIVCIIGEIGYGKPTDDDATVVERYINMEEAPSRSQYNKIAGIVDVKLTDNQTIRVGLTEDYLNVNYTTLETDAKLSVKENANDGSIDVKSIVDSLAEAREEIEKEKAEAERLKREQEEAERAAKAKAKLASRGYKLSRTQGGLVDIETPDPNYKGTKVKITGADRDMLERLVMGEAGGQGFEGAAMVAQCIRDMYLLGGYTDINTLRINCKYSGSIKKLPNQDVKDAVAFIFDEGGYAVKHRILYFYAPKYSAGKWHNTQNLILEYGGHRFFDRWS